MIIHLLIRLRAATALALGLAGLAGLAGSRASAQYSEYEVKAAFVSNFVQFVKWPDKAFPDPSAPLTIAILGNDPFGGALDKACRGQSVNGRRLTIKHSRSVDDVKGCQVVFVSKSERSRAGELIAGTQGSAVLTVGETEGFAGQGGMIGFMMEGDKVRFEINVGAARRAGLELSSKLLKLGRVIGG